MSAQEPAPPRGRRVRFRSIVVLVLLTLLLVFCILNLNIVTVKPFGAAPLFAVILVSFFLGLTTGWIVRGFSAGRSRLGTSETTSG
jgi:uncharacterized integral membrane protein